MNIMLMLCTNDVIIKGFFVVAVVAYMNFKHYLMGKIKASKEATING